MSKLVAERPGIPLCYKEMTFLAAQENGPDREFISDIHANFPARLYRLDLSIDMIQLAVAAQDQVIRKIANNGSCVIAGRAADYVLGDYEDVIHILLLPSRRLPRAACYESKYTVTARKKQGKIFVIPIKQGLLMTSLFLG